MTCPLLHWLLPALVVPVLAAQTLAWSELGLRGDTDRALDSNVEPVDRSLQVKSELIRGVLPGPASPAC